ncbi:MAG: hypothetical protein P1U57_05750 [Oleibacter sp.]|nr:hypothetical protein [Thalassolituus sp.]
MTKNVVSINQASPDDIKSIHDELYQLKSYCDSIQAASLELFQGDGIHYQAFIQALHLYVDRTGKRFEEVFSVPYSDRMF